MAMHDVDAAQMGEHREGERIVALTAHVPGVSDDAHFEVADAFAAFMRAEGEEHGLDFVGHVSRELESIAFAAAEDPAFAENRRCNVEYSQVLD